MDKRFQPYIDQSSAGQPTRSDWRSRLIAITSRWAFHRSKGRDRCGLCYYRNCHYHGAVGYPYPQKKESNNPGSATTATVYRKRPLYRSLPRTVSTIPRKPTNSDGFVSRRLSIRAAMAACACCPAVLDRRRKRQRYHTSRFRCIYRFQARATSRRRERRSTTKPDWESSSEYYRSVHRGRINIVDESRFSETKRAVYHHTAKYRYFRLFSRTFWDKQFGFRFRAWGTAFAS